MSASDRLPEPTDDLDRQRADLETHGFCFVADALTEQARLAILDRIERQAAGEEAAGLAIMDGPNQSVGNLVDKGEEFWGLLTHPIIVDLIGWLIGGEAILSSSLGKLVSRGGEPGGIHNDQGYLDLDVDEPLVANVMWMISDFSETNGGTQVIPGSHRVPRRHGDPVDLSQWVSAAGPPGTAMVFDGRLTHRTGVNVSDGRRVGVLTYWCRPWIRQQENMVASLRDETVDALPEAVKRRVGFERYRSLGGVDLSPRHGDMVDRAAPRTGRLG
ncbi:MAG: phytanoyl-CoA dioxygenase family protein [Acidimicrobiales bacterium]|nr:phytanoyl-CoA dioxygenase family protein [Acidimicrobiales bacterium]